MSFIELKKRKFQINLQKFLHNRNFSEICILKRPFLSKNALLVNKIALILVKLLESFILNIVPVVLLS